MFLWRYKKNVNTFGLKKASYQELCYMDMLDKSLLCAFVIRFIFSCCEQKCLFQTGAWGCFDEFNRINIEVLSVVAQQILSILSALAASSERFVFEGREIMLVWSCGIFITMNPGKKKSLLMVIIYDIFWDRLLKGIHVPGK